MTRPIPPLRELLKEYVTRERFDVFEKANADKFASIEHGISTRLDGLHRSLVRSRESNEELFREIMDRLGKIEGLIEKS
ncbi:MAG TPA: hypothetical protein PKA21_12350 [Kiritimatiellia bacterium]|nr:hypothetical protein [Kiritimatiellia bacterium]